MTFQDKVYEYFKVGKSYKHYSGKIMICTGFDKNVECPGYKCSEHPFFGECDGSIRPTFGTFKESHCAYCGDGTNWFTILKNSNIRW